MAGTHSMDGKDERFMWYMYYGENKFQRVHGCTQDFIWQWIWKWVECDSMDWVHLARDRLFWTQ